ncbi:hypothetical protein L228DRAFT_241264 [Xylona heveae TC161]|uniref:RRM domain-containing protein n=1 Tax=Xylona heveae (strain CBS 132557 / TC161) TaxID=1328760 RepID=A0A165A7S1_XYLHT|nr:hypothetical protein L228DRAFT_241264 [Xylona heveae TC161]KZF20076.1 hypothetical protein L228DRAFT_241264 [Xylona heveae TC161]
MGTAPQSLLEDFLGSVNTQSNGVFYCHSTIVGDDEDLMGFSSEEEDDRQSNTENEDNDAQDSQARGSESSSTVVDPAQELNEQQQSTECKLTVESHADIAGPVVAAPATQDDRTVPQYRHFFQNSKSSDMVSKDSPLATEIHLKASQPDTKTADIPSPMEAENQEQDADADTKTASVKVDKSPECSEPEIIVLRKGSHEFPPGITFRDVPKYAKIRDVLTMVRVLHARIRSILFSPGPAATIKLYFADQAAHDLFLDQARKGRVNSPWKRDLSIVIDKEDQLVPSDEELAPMHATRILQITNIPTKKLKFDTVLQSLQCSNPGHAFQLERALIFKRGNTGDASIMQLNFLSIRDSVKAKISFERGDLCIRFPLIKVDFAEDECSSTAKVVPPKLILQSRGSDVPETSPDNRLSAIGLLILPAVSVAQPAPAKILVAKPIPVAAPAQARKKGPLPGPVNGIYIRSLPDLTTPGQLLSSFRGGAVLCVEMFKYGDRQAIIYLKDPNNHSASVTRMKNNKGFLLLKDHGQAGKRYAVCGTAHQCPIGRINDPLSTRRVSFVFDNIVANNVFGTKYLEQYTQKHGAIKMESAEAPERRLIAKPTSRQEVILSYSNIAMAVEAKRVLETLKVVGATPVIKFAPDPCAGPCR